MPSGTASTLPNVSQRCRLRSREDVLSDCHIYEAAEEQRIVDTLQIATAQGFHIVLHPDAIHDISRWEMLGEMLCLENMDMRKRVGRTADEMEIFFRRLPEARFCFDIGHARQVDPSMAVAYELVENPVGFIKRLRTL